MLFPTLDGPQRTKRDPAPTAPAATLVTEWYPGGYHNRIVCLRWFGWQHRHSTGGSEPGHFESNVPMSYSGILFYISPIRFFGPRPYHDVAKKQQLPQTPMQLCMTCKTEQFVYQVVLNIAATCLSLPNTSKTMQLHGNVFVCVRYFCYLLRIYDIPALTLQQQLGSVEKHLGVQHLPSKLRVNSLKCAWFRSCDAEGAAAQTAWTASINGLHDERE